MKRLTYVLAAALLAACSGGQQGYTVTGSVENAADGDTVFLQKLVNQQMVKVDSAVIRNGAFTFTGSHDTLPEIHYLTYQAGEKSPKRMDFFLENGQIKVQLTDNNDSATGTPANDALQEIRTQANALSQQMRATYETMTTDSTLTDEQRAAKMEELSKTEEQLMNILKEGIQKHIGDAAGIHLLKSNYYQFDVDFLEPLMSQIPAEYENDSRIIRIKENVSKMRATAVGQKFTDFTMNDPEGKEVKLSDYVGKGKVVLVDFWASWCGPCRREMPNIVEAYKQYKGKKFEIVGVSLDKDAESWKAAIEKLGITWPQMSDLKFWDCEGAKLYAVSSIPHTMIIDGEGTIVARGLHGEELQEKLAELLK